jgi:hypothetical protein
MPTAIRHGSVAESTTGWDDADKSSIVTLESGARNLAYRPE